MLICPSVGTSSAANSSFFTPLSNMLCMSVKGIDELEDDAARSKGKKGASMRTGAGESGGWGLRQKGRQVMMHSTSLTSGHLMQKSLTHGSLPGHCTRYVCASCFHQVLCLQASGLPRHPPRVLHMPEAQPHLLRPEQQPLPAPGPRGLSTLQESMIMVSSLSWLVGNR